MLGPIGDAIGALFSAPVNFIRGMGDGWKLGLLAGAGAIGARLFGVEAITPERVIGIAVGGTLVGGVAGGTVNMVKGFLTSKEGQELVKDGLEHVIDAKAPSQNVGTEISKPLNTPDATSAHAEKIGI